VIVRRPAILSPRAGSARASTRTPLTCDACSAARSELLAASADEVNHAAYCRLGLLLGRLYAEAVAVDVDSIAAMFGAAFGEGRFTAMVNSEDTVLARAMRKPVAELDAADVRAFACQWAWDGPFWARGCRSAVCHAAGFSSAPEFVTALMSEDILSKKKTPEDIRPRKLLRLALELLRAKTLPDMEAAGMWAVVRQSMCRRPSASQHALECGIAELAVSSVRQAGSSEQWIRISAGSAGYGVVAFAELTRNFSAAEERLDKEALVASGMLAECLAAVRAHEQRGVEGLSDTHHLVIYQCLGRIREAVDLPECHAKIREISSALAFVLAHDLPCVEGFGLTTAANAANICAGVFGRDDGESEFVFTQEHIDNMCVFGTRTVSPCVHLLTCSCLIAG
jgi:hypothetical protein